MRTTACSFGLCLFCSHAHTDTHTTTCPFLENTCRQWQAEHGPNINPAHILPVSEAVWGHSEVEVCPPFFFSFPLGYHRDITSVRYKAVCWCVYLFLWESWTCFYCVISCNAFWGSQVVSCVWVSGCRRPTNPAGWTWWNPSDKHTSHDTRTWGHTLIVYTNDPLNDTMKAKIYRVLKKG